LSKGSAPYPKRNILSKKKMGEDRPLQGGIPFCILSERALIILLRGGKGSFSKEVESIYFLRKKHFMLGSERKPLRKGTAARGERNRKKESPRRTLKSLRTSGRKGPTRRKNLLRAPTYFIEAQGEGRREENCHLREGSTRSYESPRWGTGKKQGEKKGAPNLQKHNDISERSRFRRGGSHHGRKSFQLWPVPSFMGENLYYDRKKGG